MKYLKNIKSNVFLNALKIIMQFMVSIMLSRSIGAQGQGLVSYFFLVFDLLGTYGNFGITHAITYFYKSKGYAREMLQKTNEICLVVIWALLFGSVLVLHIQTAFLNDYSIEVIIIGGVYFLSVFLYNLYHEINVGDEKIAEMNRPILVTTVIKFFIVLLLFIVKELSVTNYIVIQMVINVILVLIMRNKLPISRGVKTQFNLIISEIKFGIIVYFSAFFGYINYRVDQLMIKEMLSNELLGVYSVGVSIAELAFFVPTCIGVALSGALYNATKEEKLKTLCNTIKYSTLVSVVVVLIGCCGSLLIPYVYGEEFRGAVIPTVILLIGIIFSSIGKIVYPFYISTGRPMIHMFVALGIALVNIVLNGIFIPSMEIIGAALASFVSYVVYGLAYIFILKHTEGIKIAKMFRISKLDVMRIKEML